MKKLLFIVSITFGLLLSACANIGRVENSFVDQGYEKSENASDFIQYVQEKSLINDKCIITGEMN